MKHTAKTLLASAMFLGTGAVSAQTPTLGEVLGASGVEISGYVDTSYTYSDTYSGLGRVTGRVFDTQRDSFNVNMIGLSMSRLPEEGFGGAVVLNAGSDANVTAAAGTNAADEFDIQQAYVAYTDGAFQVQFGKFATLIGAEVIESKDNWNFSRSILFGSAIPFTHTGVRASYAVSDAVTLTAGVNNGWDNLVDDNASKSLEFQVAMAPADNWFVNVQGMVGDEEASGKDESRTIIDVVAGIDLTDSLSLLFNADFGSQDNGAAGGRDASWTGYAGYVSYKLSDKCRLTGRYEYFDDEDGYRSGTAQVWEEATLTLAHAFSDHVEVRGEVRRDWSDKRFFAKDDGTFGKDQTTVAVEAIFMF